MGSKTLNKTVSKHSSFANDCTHSHSVLTFFFESVLYITFTINIFWLNQNSLVLIYPRSFLEFFFCFFAFANVTNNLMV